MIAIVGLGNPGLQYACTRHNTGFLVVDRVAERLSLSFRLSPWLALTAEGSHEGREVLLVKPQTFMNESGLSVGRLRAELRLPLSHILVVCDDINLELGRLRFRRSGSSGGHRGLESVISHLGSVYFPRLRIGIGPSAGSGLRGQGIQDAVEFVLSPFNRREWKSLSPHLDRAADGVFDFVLLGIEECMNRYNKAMTNDA